MRPDTNQTTILPQPQIRIISMSINPPPLSVRNLQVRYQGQDRAALASLSLDFEQGKMSAIVGPNGAGKSTLLKACLGLLPTQEDSVRFYGESLSKKRRKIAYVPQRSSIDWNFPINVREVVQQGLIKDLKFFQMFTPKSHKEMALRALQKVGLEDFSERQIAKLSGGQQQRMFLARALVQSMMNDGADIFLLDEPFAGVDASTEKTIIGVLKQLSREGKTIIAVHHNLQTVSEYFDNVVLLNTTLIANGAVSEVFTDEAITRTYLPPPSLESYVEGF